MYVVLISLQILSHFVYSSSRDIERCDRHGRNALHLVASSESIHARKMVSLLLKNGSSVGEFRSTDPQCVCV